MRNYKLAPLNCVRACVRMCVCGLVNKWLYGNAVFLLNDDNSWVAELTLINIHIYVYYVSIIEIDSKMGEWFKYNKHARIIKDKIKDMVNLTLRIKKSAVIIKTFGFVSFIFVIFKFCRFKCIGQTHSAEQ